MRLRACLGFALLALGGCAHIPAHLMLDVDGSIVEFKKKPVPEEPAAEPEQPADDEPAR